DVGGGRPLVLQHVLDEVDAPARGIELVAEEHIGRTGRGAEAAVHAAAYDFFRFGSIGIGELGQGEGCLQNGLSAELHTPAHIRPRLSTPLGSKLSLTRRVNAASAGSWGSNTPTAARNATGARTSVAWPPSAAVARRIRRAPASSDASASSQISPPAQS